MTIALNLGVAGSSPVSLATVVKLIYAQQVGRLRERLDYRLIDSIFIDDDGSPRLVLTSRGLIILAGVTLIGVGIVCLYLSDAVAATGSWWQGTLDAFGVGFVVGGIVDVTAISLLNLVLGGSAIIFRSSDREWRKYGTDSVREFLAKFGHVIDNDTMVKLHPNDSDYWEELSKAAKYYRDEVLPLQTWIDPYLLAKARALASRIDTIIDGGPALG